MKVLFLLMMGAVAALTSPALGKEARYRLEKVITGLEFPVFVTPAPGEKGVLYVVEQPGRIRRFHGGKLETVLDIRSQVDWGGEKGLLGLAFPPDYARTGKYYVNYTASRPRLQTVIAEFTRAGKLSRELLSFSQPYANHNGGMVAFGPDGYLYIATGDGGAAGDPLGAGQRRDTLLGKILRIDVRGKPYNIPKDNPIAAGQGRREIFAYGLRNPWRFSFDRKTGRLFAGDVGQNAYEEIDLIEKGGNYGWNPMEGSHCYHPPSGCSRKGLILPLWEYPRSQGISVTGGYVYRGKAVADLDGVYIYGDYGSGRIWGLHYDQEKRKVLRNELLMESGLSISSFGEDENGELLVVDHSDGQVLRLVAGKVGAKASAPGKR